MEFIRNIQYGGYNPHTVLRTVNYNPYFSKENVLKVQTTIYQMTAKEFERPIKVDEPSIKRIMQRVIEQKVDTLEKMNERVIMILTNEIRDHFLEAERNKGWEEDYTKIGSRAPIMIMGMKTNPITGRPREEKSGGTFRFHPTF